MNLETLDDMWQKDAILDDEKIRQGDSLAIPKLQLNIYVFTILSALFVISK